MEKDVNKLLTIVTVCYNSEACIERCIKSIISQIDDEVEYLIIDGKSTDNTINIIEKYSDKIRLISERDHGIYDAMNKGIKQAKGKWVLFINSDDHLLQGKVSKLINYLKEYDKYDCIYANIEEVFEYEENKYSKVFVPPDDLSSLKNDMILAHPSVVCKKSALLNVNGFNTEYKIAADWDLLLRMKNTGCTFKKIDYTFSRFYFGGASSKSHIKERHLVRKNNNSYSMIDMKMFIDLFHSLELRKRITSFFHKDNAIEIILEKKGFKKI